MNYRYKKKAVRKRVLFSGGCRGGCVPAFRTKKWGQKEQERGQTETKRAKEEGDAPQGRFWGRSTRTYKSKRSTITQMPEKQGFYLFWSRLCPLGLDYTWHRENIQQCC